MKILARHNIPAIMLAGIILAYCVLFICLSLARFYGLETAVLDLGVFDQLFWSMLHGGLPLSTLNPPFVTQNWLGFHFSPLLYGLLPFYALAPCPQTLLALNVTLIALAAIPMYLTARHWQIAPGLSLAWCVIFLVNPFTESAAIWDFHEVALATPTIGFALYAVAARKIKPLLFTMLLLLLCKEQYGLNVAGLGLLWAIIYNDWRSGMTMSIGGLLAFLLIFLLIMPFFNGAASLTEPHARFAWLLHSGSASRIFLLALACMAVLYATTLLAPFWFLPLGAWAWLLPTIGDLAVNTSSANGVMRSVFGYYNASVIVVIAVAAMRGTLTLGKKRRSLRIAQATWMILFTNLIAGWLAAPAPLPGAANLWEIDLKALSQPYREDIAHIQTILPPEASVSAQANIGSFFTQRHHIYRFPGKLDTADAIILRLATPYRRASSVFGSPFEMEPEAYTDTVHHLLKDKSLGVTYWHNSWLVLERRKPGMAVNMAEIDNALAVINAQTQAAKRLSQ